MRFLTTLFTLSLGIVFLIYLFYPNIEFPPPPSDSFQSVEPADSETSLRRSYFTNFSREEIIAHYKDQFSSLPSLRLNYPPEDAQTLIRDQTRSTYLEELALPFRESLFINGFEPRTSKDDIWYKGKHYEQKLTIRFVPSNSSMRLLVAVSTLFLIWLVFKGWTSSLHDLWTSQ